jgi:hypothetical protein
MTTLTDCPVKNFASSSSIFQTDPSTLIRETQYAKFSKGRKERLGKKKEARNKQ